MQVDATASGAPVGSAQNKYGNAFYAKRTRYDTVSEGIADYNGDSSRSWDMCNENVLNPFSGKAVAYKLVSREVPRLLPKEGSLVWKRAGFARHAVHVTRCEFEFELGANGVRRPRGVKGSFGLIRLSHAPSYPSQLISVD